MNIQSMSNDEKIQIQKEIKEIINTLISGCENLDMEMAFAMFLNAPEFLMMGTDGTLCDYQTYLKNNIDYLTACSSFNLTTFREETSILDRETVVHAWAYGVEAVLKTGEKDIVKNAGASFVFKKQNEEWKVVYYHESTVPPTRILPGQVDIKG